MKKTKPLAVIMIAFGILILTQGRYVSAAEFDTLWNYSDPVQTRANFVKLLPEYEQGEDRSNYLQLLTQIARTHGLESNFDKAHELLDRVENEMGEMSIVKVRYLLERGRAFNSNGEKEKAEPLFVESYDLALKIKEDHYAVDAAHMLAIVESEPAEQLKYNHIALKISEESDEPRAQKWKGSLYNNMGWSYHGLGMYETALDMFVKAQTFREEVGKQPYINIAKWCVARCLRSLGRYDEALDMQLALYDYNREHNTNDGYVREELGELYLIKGDTLKAEPFFADAYEMLSQDTWMVKNETDRLNRLMKLGNVKN